MPKRLKTALSKHFLTTSSFWLSLCFFKIILWLRCSYSSYSLFIYAWSSQNYPTAWKLGNCWVRVTLSASFVFLFWITPGNFSNLVLLTVERKYMIWLSLGAFSINQGFKTCLFILESGIRRDAGALVGQGDEQESKGTCERRRADKWRVGVHPEKFFGATPFRLS